MKTVVIAVVAWLAAISDASAQDSGNSLIVRQTGDGNLLTVNQALARGGSVGAVDTPAAQVGSGNRLLITDLGVGNQLPLIRQNNLIGTTPGLGNLAEITLGAGSLEAQVALSQQPLNEGGFFSAGGNSANLTLIQGAAATIQQTGSGNNALLTVNGAGASGAVLQTGVNNTGVLTVGGAGSAVTLNQTGNGLNSAGVPGGAGFQNGPAGISVLSNGGVVTITQSN